MFTATQFGHHGQIFQGVCLHKGKRTSCLLSLKTAEFQSRVTYDPGKPFKVTPDYKTKSACAAIHTFEWFEASPKGEIRIESFNECLGYGSSTADIAAVIEAIGRSFSYQFTPEEIAHIAAMSDRGVDSSMFSHAILLDLKTGEVVEDFHRALPRFFIVGFNADREGRPFFLPKKKIPTRDEDVPKYDSLRLRLREAICKADHAGIAAVATESALLRQSYLPKPNWEEIMFFKETTHALGIQIAHAGMAVGLLFKKREDALRAMQTAKKFHPYLLTNCC